MTWTAPMTAVSGELLTAAEYNKHVRDNLMETAPARALEPGGIWQSSAANQLKERYVASELVTASDTFNGVRKTYFELKNAGPRVTVTTGTSALVWISCEMGAALAGAQCSASFEVSGKTRQVATDEWRITYDAHAANGSTRTSIMRRIPLTAGSNTFRMKYRTGDLAGVHTWSNREIVVIPL
ncbi:hypothetical protein [Streptomyces sp. NPDC002855]|uniref:hypothetical protein n=1 Tax=Streptomyces sp. NPDC002855 TaxID=3154437 RepID=UPI00331BBCA7